MKETDYIKKLKHEIKKFEDWPDFEELTNYNFERLSENIKNKTKITISPLTLGRIFGRIKHAKKIYMPQIATKNAMAKYLGYESWEDFRHSNRDDKEEKILNRIRIEKTKFKQYLFSALVIAIFFTIFIFLKDKIKLSNPDYYFSCKNEMLKAPNTFMFDYDISEVKDSVFIKYGSKEKYLNPENSLFTIYVANPQTLFVKIYTRKKTLETISIHALTNGWFFNINESNTYLEFSDSSIIKNGKLGISKDNLIERGLDLDKKHLLHFINFKEFGISADSMTISTRFKNPGNISCNTFSLTFSGVNENGFIQIVPENCHRWAVLKIAENKMYGSNYDLSALGQDLHEWKTIDISLKNKTLNILIDSTSIFKTDYKNNLGELIGLTYSWSCCGEVDWVKIFDNYNNKIVYQDDFDR